MAKLCPRGKAAAKRKFKVYPSAYANMYASAVCSGKVTPGGKKGKRKKAAGGGFIGRQDTIGIGFQTAGKLGTAAATGGASLLGDALGGFGSSGMTFDTGSGAVSAAPPPAPQPFYTKPVFLIGAGLAAFLLLRPRNGRR